ncbi:MAG: hypothetical protein CM1200mP2_15100 [Planctomycetaceae bacterium]|nr:MAG: hypothetical protein CM1200mP2_15100 [Planctomycetaceae bacterium]
MINAMTAALADADLSPADVGHIHAHGLSARETDVIEASAIAEVFGETAGQVPVTAMKSALGNFPGVVAAPSNWPLHWWRSVTGWGHERSTTNSRMTIVLWMSFTANSVPSPTRLCSISMSPAVARPAPSLPREPRGLASKPRVDQFAVGFIGELIAKRIGRFAVGLLQRRFAEQAEGP